MKGSGIGNEVLTDDSLKKQAYLEGARLKKSGLDNSVILARLEKKGYRKN